MTARALPPTDLALMTLLAVIPLLSGYALGAMVSAPAINLPCNAAYIAACAGFEWAFLAWAGRRVPRPLPGMHVRAFALRIQAQVVLQMVTRCMVIAAMLYPIDALLFQSAEMESARSSGFSWAVFWFLSKLAIVYAISISWWRCLSLRRHGADFAALSDNSFIEKRVAIPMPYGTVSPVLDKYVERLTSPRTPRFSRMFYQANTLIDIISIDGRTAYSITWALLPVRIVVTLVPDGVAAGLGLRCVLRGGIHRLELYPNPAIVLPVMRYLQTNLLEPLTSELALSSAVRQQGELRQQAIESQLRMLQAQIEPHFLFNTLANVRHLYRSSVDEGESMMDHLIMYLRSTLEELRSDVSTVGKEMDLVLHYLSIMKIRMGQRLSYSFIHADDVTDMAFPPAMLISLVENAIMHGLNNRPDGRLSISALREAGHLRVTVLDNGAGFSSVQGSGVGLSNIRQRLEALYGSRAWLEVGSPEAGGFMASIVIPFLEKA